MEKMSPSSDHPMFPSPQAKKLYRDWLSQARIEESETAIPNELPWHSRCAVAELTQFAIDKQVGIIRLLSGTITENVYDTNWVKLILQYLSKGGELRILVWDNEIPDSTAQRLCTILESDNATLRLSKTRRGGEELNHFFVVGEQAFRKEAPHRYCNGGEFSDINPEIPAQICFNDPNEAASLIDIFDQVWEVCAE